MQEAGRTQPEAEHNHTQCVESALEWAERVCSARGARLTTLRRRVLQYVWDSHKAVKAYDILEMLGAGEAKPPTVYRALQFLQDCGLVHRLECLNAFIGCPFPDREHVGQFLICNDCGVVTEMRESAIQAALSQEAHQAGFLVERETVELRGRCERCCAGGEAL